MRRIKRHMAIRRHMLTKEGYEVLVNEIDMLRDKLTSCCKDIQNLINDLEKRLKKMNSGNGR